jgi:hypothetical protein
MKLKIVFGIFFGPYPTAALVKVRNIVFRKPSPEFRRVQGFLLLPFPFAINTCPREKESVSREFFYFTGKVPKSYFLLSSNQYRNENLTLQSNLKYYTTHGTPTGVIPNDWNSEFWKVKWVNYFLDPQTSPIWDSRDAPEKVLKGRPEPHIRDTYTLCLF